MGSLGANLPGLVSLALILGGAAMALAVASRWVRGGGRARDREVVRLTPQHQLHVVEVAGQRLIVGTGPGGAPRLVYALAAQGERPHAVSRGPSHGLLGEERSGDG